MKSNHWKTRLGMVVAALVLLSGFLMWEPVAEAIEARAEVIRKRTPNEAELQALLHRLGFGPEALTAVGGGGDQIPKVIEGVVAKCQEDDRSIGEFDRLVAESRKSISQTQQRVRSGQSAEDDEETLIQAPYLLEDRVKKRDAYVDELFNAGAEAAGLSTMQTTTIKVIRGNRTWDTIPIEYRTVHRTEEEWLDLKAAVLRSKRGIELGLGPPTPEQHVLLATAGADPRVIQARQWAAERGEAIGKAWTEAVSAKADRGK